MTGRQGACGRLRVPRAAVPFVVAAASLAACGSGSAGDEPWRAGHPDPAGMTFEQQAPGICALTPQYPEQAPAAIDYLGTTYVQRSRGAAGQPPGKVAGRSAGWTVSVSGNDLYIDTGSALFAYRPAPSC